MEYPFANMTREEAKETPIWDSVTVSITPDGEGGYTVSFRLKEQAGDISFPSDITPKRPEEVEAIQALLQERTAFCLSETAAVIGHKVAESVEEYCRCTQVQKTDAST